MSTEWHSELRYKIRYPYLTFSNPPQINLAITPDFDGFNRVVSDDCVVFDLFMLIESLQKTGEYYLMTCECGYPDDVGIDAPLHSICTETQIIWLIPLENYPDIFAPLHNEKEEGLLKIIFDKQQYRQTVRNLLNELKLLCLKGIEVAKIKPSDFTRTYFKGNNKVAQNHIDNFIQEYPTVTHIELGEILPFNEIKETLMEIDVEAI